jgi:two-component system cell cycle response regulator
MKQRVLIIEDNPANLELMTYLFQAFGYTPLTALNGVEGLELARSEAPDLILCDIRMIGMDGYEVVRRIKSDPALKKIITIAVTAHAMVGDGDRILAAGFDGYLAKPIDPETFVGQVESFLGPSLSPSVLSAQVHDSTRSERDALSTGDRASILVLDDVDSNLSLARSILEPQGYLVVTAKSVPEACALARAHPPDLFLSDVHIPHESGFDFLRVVKSDAALCHLPFIFLSSTIASSSDKAKALGLASGADRVLVRPIEMETLIAEIETCLEVGKRNRSEE